MADGEDLDDEPIVFDDAQGPVASDAVAPFAGAAGRQALPVGARVGAALKVLADPRQDEAGVEPAEAGMRPSGGDRGVAADRAPMGPGP